MKRLCFGSCIKILVLCKSAAGNSQKNICRSIILSIAPDYFMGDEDRCTSDWANCRKNLPSDVVAAAKKIIEQDDKAGLQEVIRKNVLPLINDNQKSDVILALKDIIANDTHIKPDTVVDKVDGLTKDAIISTNTFVIEDFLTGIFLYTVTVLPNTEGENSVKAIDEGYMRQFSCRESEVEFVEKLRKTLNANESEPHSSESNYEFVDGEHIENDFSPNLQQNIYNQSIDVNGNGNVINGFVFNLNNRG